MSSQWTLSSWGVSDRDAALEALRTYARPHRRSELVAAAWHAGETTISTLAAVAGVTRQTIYDDLRSQGIDYTQRRKGPTMITIDGFTGADEEGEQLHPKYVAQQLGMTEPSQRNKELLFAEFERRAAAHSAAMYHNKLLPLVQREAEARSQVQAARARMDHAWQSLEDPTAPGGFLTRHHRYVVAVDQALRAVEGWKRAYSALRTKVEGLQPYRTYYEQRVSADERLSVELDADPDQVLAELDGVVEHRDQLLAKTLRFAHSGGEGQS